MAEMKRRSIWLLWALGLTGASQLTFWFLPHPFSLFFILPAGGAWFFYYMTLLTEDF